MPPEPAERTGSESTPASCSPESVRRPATQPSVKRGNTASRGLYVQAVQAETKTLKIARSTLKADEGPPPTVLPQILRTQKGMVTADTANLKEAQAVLASCIHANGG